MIEKEEKKKKKTIKIKKEKKIYVGINDEYCNCAFAKDTGKGTKKSQKNEKQMWTHITRNPNDVGERAERRAEGRRTNDSTSDSLPAFLKRRRYNLRRWCAASVFFFSAKFRGLYPDLLMTSLKSAGTPFFSQ